MSTPHRNLHTKRRAEQNRTEAKAGQRNQLKRKKQQNQNNGTNFADHTKINEVHITLNSTLFAHISPHALHKVLGPSGPLRIIGVNVELTPQC